jgi:hypothetical protein
MGKFTPQLLDSEFAYHEPCPTGGIDPVSVSIAAAHDKADLVRGVDRLAKCSGIIVGARGFNGRPIAIERCGDFVLTCRDW